MTTEMEVATPGRVATEESSHAQDNPTRLELSPEHRAEILDQSAVSDEVAAARGYRTLYGTSEDRRYLSSLGFKQYQYDRDEAFPALLVPMYRATGEVISYQLKLSKEGRRKNDKGKEIKYENPVGSKSCVDVPPSTQGIILDVNKPLWITEGMKKVDSLVSKGRAAIGLQGVFNWRKASGTLGDWEDIPLKGRDVVICFDADARTNRNVQLAMRRFGRWLESKGAKTVYYLIVPEYANGKTVKGVDDFFATGGSLKDLQDAASKIAPTDGPKDDAFTDARLAERAAEGVLEGRFRFVRGMGWLEWNGKVWSETDSSIPRDAVRVWAQGCFNDALTDQAKDPSRNMSDQINGWRSALSKNRLDHMVDLASAMRESEGGADIRTEAGGLDGDPWLLNCLNGVVCLSTGDLYEHDPCYLMTKIAEAEYEPSFQHEDWEKALEALPEDARDWYQLRIGQAATGKMTPDDLLVISHGTGENGKSCINEGIQKTLGSYAVLLSDRVLMANPDAHPTELMDLKGTRYAILEETPEARRLDVNRLKKTVGTERIRARRIRQDPVEFKATHSLFINTNFAPEVTETDHGTWRRLALLPFPYTFLKPGQDLTGPNDRHGDPALRQRLSNSRDAAKAVLAWIVAGSVRFYSEQDGIMPQLPTSVETATRDWRKETDTILGFTDEFLVFERNAHIPARDLHEVFGSWLEERGMHKWTDKTFSARFSAHEVVRNERVEKRNARSKEGLSRPDDRIRPMGGFDDSDLGARYHRWVGVRFRTDQDEAQGGTGGTAVPETPYARDEIGVNGVCRSTRSTSSLPQAAHAGFKSWLAARGADSPLGTRYTDLTQDPGFPDSDDQDACVEYLNGLNVGDQFFADFLSAWKAYEASPR